MGELIKSKCSVIGGGLGGKATALHLADAGEKVDFFTKTGSYKDCNSYLIAGGLAGVKTRLGLAWPPDSFKKHIEDTCAAGKGLNDPNVVEDCVKNFWKYGIKWLIDQGVPFDKGLHREGGHSEKRIVHYRDTTGAAIMKTLDGRLRNHPNIEIYENHLVIDMITENKVSGIHKQGDRCLGFYAYDINRDEVVTVAARGVFAATGGLGKVFKYTSNPDIASGDGFAFCYRAGLPLMNMEFIQFHPTVFYDPLARDEFGRRQLFTEGLRGEGAIIKLFKEDKEDLIKKYHQDGSKSTRDVVTRAMDAEMRGHKLDHLWLDCTSIDGKRLKNNFKDAYEFALSKDFDLAKEPIPVVYAVHYSNGGVLCGSHGQTALDGFYVIGELAYTGIHGATRLASNSGTECVYYAGKATRHYLKNSAHLPLVQEVPLWDIGKATKSRDLATVNHYWDSIRRTMNSLCGMVRNEQRLRAGLQDIESFQKTINEMYWEYTVNRDFLELRNIADLAGIIMKSAYLRKETRACHVREDFPETDDGNYRRWTVIQKDREPFLMDFI